MPMIIRIERNIRAVMAIFNLDYLKN
jgi:hypothetical protein